MLPATECKQEEKRRGDRFARQALAPEDGSRGYSSMVEPQPSKLMARVRFPLPAPVRGQAGSGLPGWVATRKGFAHIAQSVEHFLGKEEVTGSNPVMSSTLPGPENRSGQEMYGARWRMAVRVAVMRRSIFRGDAVHCFRCTIS
jgi:hypothetical protein